MGAFKTLGIKWLRRRLKEPSTQAALAAAIAGAIGMAAPEYAEIFHTLAGFLITVALFALKESGDVREQEKDQQDPGGDDTGADDVRLPPVELQARSKSDPQAEHERRWRAETERNA